LHSLFKTLASLALRSSAVAEFVRRRRRVRLVSLCFHRFAGPDNAASGDDLDAINEGLLWLKRAGFAFDDLATTVQGILAGRFPDRPTVVVTIDDGFADLRAAVPVFARHQCPVSVFLATDFLDSRRPLWWDQVQLLLAKAPGRVNLTDVSGITWSAAWSTSSERVRGGEVLIELVKRSREPARHQVIAALAAQVGVALPFGETKGYAPLTWDDVRALEKEGVRFGPHTHTHPILSALDDESARYEIEMSWARVREEVRRPLPIFAYPDGTPWSFLKRDAALVRAAGMDAAVTMNSRWVLPAEAPVDPYEIGRIGYQSKLPDLQAAALRLGIRGRSHSSKP
jgi:peptidoglycan/xylan/chitin deacetylase (PgdA/CDA1 family)